MELQLVIGSLWSLFQPGNLMFLIIGIVVGLVVGFIPGLGGVFALALLLPFTFHMEPFAAIALLLGAHAVIVNGGSISSILFNTPGSVGNAATIFDGYPLARKGEAERAISAAQAASALGSIFGALILILLVPLVKPVVLAFGLPEFFALGVLGISMVASMGAESTLKGLIAACVGLMLATVGMEPSFGVVRFGFGQMYLWDGIPLIPVVMGLFAITEVLCLTEVSLQGGGISQQSLVKGGRRRGVFDVFKNWWLVLRCSAIGAAIGIIPGIGGEVATFVSYGHAVQSSKEREKFGQGVIQGVIAPESANNAKEGGMLLPTLVFGLPGAAPMAIFLGAMLIWGIVPGPAMVNEPAGRSLIYYMFWILVVAGLTGAIVTLSFVPWLSKLTVIRLKILVPLIVVFALVGTYVDRNNFADLVLALGFGILGYFMAKYDYSRATLILGLVLGRIIENNLNLTIRTYDGLGFLTRPLTMLILALAVSVVILSVVQKFRSERTEAGVLP